MMELTASEIALKDVVDSVRRPAAGAIVAFVGTVRREEGLEGLEVQAYDEMAMRNLAVVRQRALEDHGALEASLVHRVGITGVGDDLVAIAVSAPHRSEAFAACRYMIDELKASVPMWKRELGRGTWVKGQRMREPGGHDGQGGGGDGDSSDGDSGGGPRGMVDVSGKPVVSREAIAEGLIELTRASVDAIRSGDVPKGDVLEVARVAAILGVKRTSSIVPHCHPVPVTGVDVGLEVVDGGVRASCRVRADYRTGVEMEALTGVTCALLTVWDMVKYLEKDAEGQYPKTRIRDVRVVSKAKGGVA